MLIASLAVSATCASALATCASLTTTGEPSRELGGWVDWVHGRTVGRSGESEVEKGDRDGWVDGWARRTDGRMGGEASLAVGRRGRHGVEEGA